MKNTNEDIEEVKTPLAYQITEYDCAPATMLNALRYLFYREEILPGMVKDIIKYTLDTYSANQERGMQGTSSYVMGYLVNWINNIIVNLKLDLKAKLLVGEDVDINNKELVECIKSGGVAVLRVWQECEHYVLCTNIDEENVYIFDPYYLDEDYYNNDDACEVVLDKVFEYNRIVKKERLNEKSINNFALVRNKNAQILLMYRRREK